MRKRFIVTVISVVLLLGGLAQETKAQFYSQYTYNNNAYVNYALASQRAKAAGRRAKLRHSKRHRPTRRPSRTPRRHRK